MSKAKKVTPLMKQYNAIKVKYPDALLLFRVGDFYETFGQDAVKAAGILNITLTARNNGGEQTPLAGFPHHSVNTYLPKLVMAGCRVAICDQLEDPKQTKTIVKRGVTELITPGVALNDGILEAGSNNFLAAVHFSPGKGGTFKNSQKIGVSFLDISTGEFLSSEGNAAYVDKLLQNFNPSEVLFSKQKRKLFSETFGDNFHVFHLEDWVFHKDYALETLHKHFDTKNLKGFGVDHLEHGTIASGAALHYLAETQHNKLKHITKIARIAEDQYVWMDRFTIRNLELYHSHQQNAVTLLDVIDKTISPMGGRMLKRWMALPLKNKEAITRRHEVVSYLLPVIEKQLPPDAPYISNDVFLDQQGQQIIMITGPNMSGKSAILRQTALIVLLAQMGSFVPATKVRMGVVDKIFTRVGASDNISMGESTFMVEMNETASILNNLSARSLILLDEIGRGTSTYDGISIAWAISEYLHEHPSKAKVLFATHYHEINEMATTFDRIKNFTVSVKELKDDVLFLRKLVPGGSHHSFGIHVAKMAGMPQGVLRRANTILKRLEKTHSSEALSDTVTKLTDAQMQLSFFNLDDPLLEELRDQITELDIDTLTPVEALLKLNEIKRMLQPPSGETPKK